MTMLIHPRFELSLMFFLKNSDLSCPVEERVIKTLNLRKELKQKYGDQYDLSRVIYVNTRTPIELICGQHGIFKQHYLAHKEKFGGGCKDCRADARKEALVEQFKAVHGDRYNYTNLVIRGVKVKVNCYEHGDFWVTSSSHAKSESAGCVKCRLAECRDELIKQYQVIHNNKYDYSEMVFTKSKIKIRIKCPEHGVFEQLPTAHKEGQGCPKCAGRFDEQALIQMFNRVHQNRYRYTRIPSAQKREKITFLCDQHGEFSQTIQKHLEGAGCPVCEI